LTRVHIYGVGFLAFSPDEHLLISAGSDGEIKIRETVSGNEVVAIKAYSSLDPVVSACLSRDGKVLAACSLGRPTTVWNTSSGQKVTNIDHYRDICSLAYAPNQDLLACGTASGPIRLWDLSRKCEIRTLIGHEDIVNALAFSPNGKLLASVSDDRTAKLWDIGSGAVRWTYRDTYQLLSLAFSPNGETLAFAKSSLPNTNVRDGHVRLLWLPGQRIPPLAGRLQRKRSPISFREAVKYVRALDYSPTGSHLAIITDDVIELWNVYSKSLEAILRVDGFELDKVAWSPAGTWLACGTTNGSIKLWSLVGAANTFIRH
jgi:WD40 repeat protein